LLPAFFLFISLISFSQAIPDGMPGIGDKGTYEKLYLHTDRDYYFLGDTIWFKAYYLNGQTQRFLQGDANMHAELIDKSGNKIQDLLLSERRKGPGQHAHTG